MWPGQPMTAHWGVADPAAVEDPRDVARAVNRTFLELDARIKIFTILRLENLDRLSLQRQLDAGRTDQSGNLEMFPGAAKIAEAGRT